MAAEDFTALMLELLSGVAVRPRFGKHPRLAIWGPLEARLQQADLLVLGSLNEGTWPAESAIDPWLNRPMRQGFGLPAPERKIGLSAHDFQQAMGAPKVLLTRAERVDGAPTVPSRWLLRLDAFLTCAAEGLPSNAGALERRLAHLIDRPQKVEPGVRPMPRPGAARRPAQLSVTQIEAWRRNPYAIYARHILRLKKLDPLDQDPGAADLGNAVHKALHAFTERFPHALPSDALALLRADGEAAFQPWLDRPNVWAFWQPRFQRIAAWWLGVERGRRTALMTAIATEREGELAAAGTCIALHADRARRSNRRVARRRPDDHRLQDRHPAEEGGHRARLRAAIDPRSGDGAGRRVRGRRRHRRSPSWRTGNCPAIAMAERSIASRAISWRWPMSR